MEGEKIQIGVVDDFFLEIFSEFDLADFSISIRLPLSFLIAFIESKGSIRIVGEWIDYREGILIVGQRARELVSCYRNYRELFEVSVIINFRASKFLTIIYFFRVGERSISRRAFISATQLRRFL